MTDTTHPNPSIRELHLAPDGEIEILLTANELRLRGTDEQLVVIRARGGEDLDDGITIDETTGHLRIQDGGAGEFRLGPLRMRTRRPADLDVDVPRTARLSVRTLSGDVDAAGIGGPSRWATASGDLRLKVTGGPVSIESVSGDVTLEGSEALAVTARSVSGALRIRAPRLGALGASTTSGDVVVEAALDEGAEHLISSISGDVRLATGSAVRLEAQSIAGEVRASVAHRAEGGRGRRTIVVGDGRVRVSVRTTSGDVNLVGGPGGPGAPVSAVQPPPGAGGAPDRREAARLEVLRAVERGDLDIEAASLRLEALGEAGPRSFRGWC